MGMIPKVAFAVLATLLLAIEATTAAATPAEFAVAKVNFEAAVRKEAQTIHEGLRLIREGTGMENVPLRKACLAKFLHLTMWQGTIINATPAMERLYSRSVSIRQTWQVVLQDASTTDKKVRAECTADLIARDDEDVTTEDARADSAIADAIDALQPESAPPSTPPQSSRGVSIACGILAGLGEEVPATCPNGPMPARPKPIPPPSTSRSQFTMPVPIHSTRAPMVGDEVICPLHGTSARYTGQIRTQLPSGRRFAVYYDQLNGDEVLVLQP